MSDPVAPGSSPPNAPPVVATDLEGTCTAGETWRGVGRWLAAHGRGGRYRRFLVPRVAAIPLVRLGLIERQAFRNRWIRDLVRLLDGLSAAELAALAEEVVETELWPKRLIATGTYEPVLAAFAARLPGGPAGPVGGLGTPLEIRDGRTTGRTAGPIGTGELKAARVRAFAGGARVVAAYGDSLADVPLLELADEAVAVAPDGELRPVALARGWRILDAPAAEA